METMWAKNLLTASERANEEQQRLFLGLVDMAFNKCTLEIARTLMKTFTSNPDYGTQERVISVFATAPNAIITQAVLEELPRLSKEAPEWAETLIGLEVEKRPQLLQQIAIKMPEENKRVLRSLLNNKEFEEFYPNSRIIRF